MSHPSPRIRALEIPLSNNFTFNFFYFELLEIDNNLDIDSCNDTRELSEMGFLCFSQA